MPSQKTVFYNTLSGGEYMPTSVPVSDSSFKNLAGDMGTIFIGIILILSAYLLLMGAWKRMGVTGSASSVKESNEFFTKFAFGVVSSALLFPLIFFLYPTFGTLTFKYITDFSKAQREDDTVGGSPNTGNINTPPTGNMGSKNEKLVFDNEEAMRNTLRSMNISVNKVACEEIDEDNCTNVGGLSPSAVDILKKLKEGCGGCDIQITGGTEWWSHGNATRHTPGGGAIDLAEYNQVSAFIRKQAKAQPWSICYEAYTFSGYYFCDEKKERHWHAQ